MHHFLHLVYIHKKLQGYKTGKFIATIFVFQTIFLELCDEMCNNCSIQVKKALCVMLPGHCQHKFIKNNIPWEYTLESLYGDHRA